MKRRDGQDDDSMGDDDDHEGAQVTKPGVNFRSNKLFFRKIYNLFKVYFAKFVR